MEASLFERCDGIKLDFSLTGNARPFLREGWSFPEAKGTWAIGNTSVIALPPSVHSGQYELHFTVVPMVWRPMVEQQRFSLRINGLLVLEGTAVREGITQFSCTIPRGAMSAVGVNRLEIMHGDAVAPSAVGESGEQRVLSLRFVEMRVTSTDPETQERTLSRSHPLFLITGLALPGQRPMLELPRFLACEECEILLWIDFKDPSDFGPWKSAVEQELPLAHVELAPRAVWGGPSTVQSILGGIAFAIDKIPNWTRVVICSDRDVPLLRREDILGRIWSLRAYDFVGSRWNQSTNDLIPAAGTIPVVDSIFDHSEFRTYRVRQEMVFKVEEALARLYPEEAIRNLTIARTMPNRYRAAVSEGNLKDALILSRLTRTRAIERERFWQSMGLVAGRLWIMASRKLAEMLVSDRVSDIFNEGFRDVLNTDECFFQSVANFYCNKGEIEPLWAGLHFDDAHVFRVDRQVYLDMLTRKSGIQMFGRKAVEHFCYDQIVGQNEIGQVIAAL
jgi:hypothetical protein